MKINVHKLNYSSAPYRGAKQEAAKEMGISYTNFQNKLRKNDLDAVRILAKIVKARHDQLVDQAKQAKQEAIIEVEKIPIESDEQ